MNTTRTERYVTGKLMNLYRKAREVHPLTEEGGRLLAEAADFRKICEESAAPMVTRITGENASRFVDLMTPDVMEEILVGKCVSIGGLRSGEDGRLFAVAAAVYYEDREELEGRRIMRIRWLYVHPAFRKQGIGNALLGELGNRMHLGGFSAASIDLPADGEESPLKQLLVKWKFIFERGADPDFVLLLSDIMNEQEEELWKMTESIRPLSDLEPDEANRIIEGSFEKSGYDGFLQTVPSGYINYSLSGCYFDRNGQPEALALVHVTPSREVRVEYCVADGEDEVLVLNLVAFVALNARTWLGKKTVLRMRLYRYESAYLFDRAFPKQRGSYIEEGVLF